MMPALEPLAQWPTPGHLPLQSATLSALPARLLSKAMSKPTAKIAARAPVKRGPKLPVCPAVMGAAWQKPHLPQQRGANLFTSPCQHLLTATQALPTTSLSPKGRGTATPPDSRAFNRFQRDAPSTRLTSLQVKSYILNETSSLPFRPK